MEPFFAYDANYLIDNKAGIILDAEGTRANRIAEMAVTQTESPHAAPNGILAIFRSFCKTDARYGGLLAPRAAQANVAGLDSDSLWHSNGLLPSVFRMDAHRPPQN